MDKTGKGTGRKPITGPAAEIRMGVANNYLPQDKAKGWAAWIRFTATGEPRMASLADAEKAAKDNFGGYRCLKDFLLPVTAFGEECMAHVPRTATAEFSVWVPHGEQRQRDVPQSPDWLLYYIPYKNGAGCQLETARDRIQERIRELWREPESVWRFAKLGALEAGAVRFRPMRVACWTEGKDPDRVALVVG